MATSLFGNKMITLGGSKDEKNIWNTQRINQYLYNLQHGIKQEGAGPFFERKLGIRRGELNFFLTPEEEREVERCMSDVVYFADKYCFAMTDKGVQKIQLRDYQKKVLREFQNNRFTVFLSARQIGKTITSSFFLTWYFCFHIDRNSLVVANRAFTMREIMDKIKVVYRNLPFFLKPGAMEYNKEAMVFDNGCKIVGESTSATPALGFTIHLLYADEFAHVPENIIEPFYQNVYPTLSSSDISKIIITSTPNGLNKFYEIYTGAWKKENEYVPIRVDWWEVPGRDQKWRDREIGNLGSIEAFNQQYGNQFLSNDRLLIDYNSLVKLERIKQPFIWRPLYALEDLGVNYQNLKWSPQLKEMNWEPKRDKFILSVDIADGIGQDYSIINIFQLVPLSKAKIRTLKKYKDESSFFRLKQIGIFRSNQTSIDDFANILSTLMFDVFGADMVNVVLEVNFKGDLLIDKLSKHKEYYDEILLHTKHSQSADYLNPGIKLNKQNKPMMCNEFSHMLKEGKIVITEEQTTLEAASFGLDKKDNYSSQLGHDDIMMTCINLIAYLQSPDFYDNIEDIIDQYSDDLKVLIDKKLQNATDEDKNGIDYGLLRDVFNQ